MREVEGGVRGERGEGKGCEVQGKGEGGREGLERGGERGLGVREVEGGVRGERGEGKGCEVQGKGEGGREGLERGGERGLGVRGEEGEGGGGGV